MFEMKHYEKGQDPYRYTIIIAYMFAGVVAGMGANPLTPIATTAGKIYNLRQPFVTLTTAIYSIAGVLFGVPANRQAVKSGVRTNMIIGSMLLSVGFIVRILVNENFLFVYFGQGIAGAGVPYIACIQLQVVEEWFGRRDRPLWIAFTSVTFPLGILIGYLLPLIFDPIKSDQLDFDAQQRLVFSYFFFEACLSIFGFFLVAFSWRESKQSLPIELVATKPDEKRSLLGNQSVRTEVEPKDLWAHIKVAKSQPSATPAILLYGGSLGLLYSHIALTSSFLGCYLQKEQWGPMITISTLVGSLISSFAFIRKVWNIRQPLFFNLMGLWSICLFSIPIILLTLSDLTAFLALLAVSFTIGIPCPPVFMLIPLSLQSTSLLLGQLLRDFLVSLLVGFGGTLGEEGNMLKGVLAGYGIATLSLLLVYLGDRVDHSNKIKFTAK